VTEAREMQRVLIFGGTFDPPHRAHVELPPRIAQQLGCDRLLYVPAALNPLKVDSPPTDSSHRLEMLRRAVVDVPNAEICTIELERKGPSYTVDTLEELRRRLGEDVEMRLLIGGDQALEFHRWKDWKRIIELAEPVVMLRPPWNRETFREQLAV
jgi:nicotinate-nucleotide adenylyltransferase